MQTPKRIAPAAAMVLAFVLAAQAKEAPPATGAHHAAPSSTAEHPASSPLRLPPDSITQHTLALAGRNLHFKATAGTVKLMNQQGDALADIAYVAYQLDGAAPNKRPVAFVFNGGPGAGSAWLDLGALGPWQLPLDQGAIYPSASPVPIDNADTWLDFTDLVFFDPPGTGYSQILGGEAARKQLYSVNGDIEGLAVVIRKWLAANDRLASPKFVVGESYGGFRGPRLAEKLTTEQGIGISGLVLISPALDFRAMSSPNEALTWAIRLPSFAATLREGSGPGTEAQLADVERYATGEYVQDFIRGPRDAAAVARIVDRVTRFTGLDRDLVARRQGRIDKETFLRGFDPARRKVGADYDATVTAYDPSPESRRDTWLDPIVPGFEAPMASAMTWLYEHKLGWKIENQYRLLNDAVSEAWDFGPNRRVLDDIPALKRMLALDPHFQVLVAQGLTDLVVPYFSNKLLLAQIPDYGPPGRLTFKTYGGGHMLYTRDASRKALREDARKLIQGK